jgi:hypothetical protein
MGRAEDIRRRHEERLKKIQNNRQRTGKGDASFEKYFLGNNGITKKEIRLDAKDFQKHWHILGATGKGKTKFIEHIVRMLIEQNQGLCLIDPHGDLYESLRGYTVKRRLGNKVILLNPNEEECLFGLNYLERTEYIQKDFGAHVEMVMEAISKVFGGEKQEAMPTLQRWERNVIHSLMEQNLTLVEMLDFLSLSDPVFRNAIVSNLNDEYIKKDLSDFESYHRTQKEIKFESVLNRAAKFVGDLRIRRIVGQTKSTVNFRQAMDEGKIVLINLSPLHISQQAKRMLGIMVVDLIVQAAFSRQELPESKRKPFYFIVDEFGEFVSHDFAYALEALRKYGVFFMLSNQQMDQLKRENERVYHSVMSNCTNKVTFGVSREDAEVMAKEIFTGMIRGDKIKRALEQTKFKPVESRRITYSNSSTTGTSSAESSALGRGEVNTEGLSQMYGPDGPIYFADALSQNVIEGKGRSSSETTARSHATSEAESSSYTDAPWYDYQEFRELSSVVDYSIEEQVEKFISWIKNQGPRQAQIKIDTDRPVPIVTPFVEDLRIYRPSILKFEEENKKVYAKNVKDIDEEIEERRKQILDKSKNEYDDLDTEDFRE